MKSFWKEFEEHFFQKGFLKVLVFMNNLGSKWFPPENDLKSILSLLTICVFWQCG
jgi:hypothetical protein